ncbi:MAG: protein kinase [Parabacteroides sp.]
MITIQGTNEKRLGIYYEVNENEPPLGVGGMGQVFRGCRVEANGVRKEVAIKFLFDDLPDHVIERARREASIQIHNENLVEMFGFIQVDEVVSSGVTRPHYHVVSELLHGVMLFDLLKGKTTDNNGEEIAFAAELYQMYTHNRNEFALFIIKNLLAGILALHDKGFIHRDIDPSNIMITADGKVKLIDFGIAKQLTTLVTQDKQLTTTGQFMGKAAYAAPELVHGDVRHQNATTDIYAVGILFFQLVTGELPFDGATNDVLNMQLHKKVPLKLITSKGIRNVIAKATEKKQADRYQSAAEFRVAVEQIKLSEPSIAERLFEQKKMVAAAGIGLLLIVCGWGVSKMISSHEQEKELALIEQQRLKEERIAELENKIIDSYESVSELDSITGIVVKSSALLTEEALQDLLNPSNASNGVQLLRKVVDKKYQTSAEAAYWLGRLQYEGKDPLDSVQHVKQQIVNVLEGNNRAAHELIELAVQLDSTSYKALYELGCDYYAGKIRTGNAVDRDSEKALEYFKRGYRFAQEKKDNYYMDLFMKRIKELS